MDILINCFENWLFVESLCGIVCAREVVILVSEMKIREERSNQYFGDTELLAGDGYVPDELDALYDRVCRYILNWFTSIWGDIVIASFWGEIYL